MFNVFTFSCLHWMYDNAWVNNIWIIYIYIYIYIYTIQGERYARAHLRVKFAGEYNILQRTHCYLLFILKKRHKAMVWRQPSIKAYPMLIHRQQVLNIQFLEEKIEIYAYSGHKSALVQVKAWSRTGAKLLLEPTWTTIFDTIWHRQASVCYKRHFGDFLGKLSGSW